MSRLQHTIISASAGSGKTYQLANRFIALLLLQASAGRIEPERLVAVTFTRKGAGEFLDRILTRMARAAGDQSELRKLKADLDQLIQGDAENEGLCPGARVAINAAVLQQALAAFFDQLDRLVLGTIDSFMTRSVQTLAFELGLGGFEILEPHAAELSRRELLATVFRQVKHADLAAFHQTLKRATLKSSASLRNELDRFVRAYHKLLVSLPDREAWGGSKFWGAREVKAPGRAWQQQARELRERVVEAALESDLVSDGLTKVLDWLASREPGIAGKPPTWLEVNGEKGPGRLLRLWEQWPDADWNCLPRANSRRPCVVPARIMRPLRAVLTDWIEAERHAFTSRTAAIASVVGDYELVYDQHARRRGKLAFDDLPFLLSERETPEELVSVLGFRWYQGFDHWLLDEFQDTSRVQWRVLQSWLDEAIQDNSGTKSVFVVGDPKQSIYGWRGGEPRLFEELSQGYPGAFAKQVMVESWRSRPAVLELVNSVCDPGRNPVLLDPVKLAPPARDRWAYRSHTPSTPRTWSLGYAAVIQVEKQNGDAENVENGETDAEGGVEVGDKLASQARAIQSVLEQLQPLENGLSVAILVRKNANAQAIAHWLRAHDVRDVMVEGDATLAGQSPVVAALVDALRWLETPANTLAARHVEMTPLWPILAAAVETTESVRPGHIWRHWRLQVNALGATEVTRRWCHEIGQTIRDQYVTYCLRQVVQLAHRVGPVAPLADWIAALETLTVRESSSGGCVHIMTVHRAKGLGFDVVFLPDLDLGGGGPEGILLRRDPQGVPVACLLSPPKWLRAWMPELQTLKETADAEQDLESLCVLYVALTRAKEATFVIVQKEKPRNAARARDWLLGGTSGAAPQASPWGVGELLWESGTRDFTAGVGDKESKPPVLVPQPEFRLATPVPRRTRGKPSEAGHEPPASLHGRVNLDNRVGQEFGTAVHAAFEQVEWYAAGQVMDGDSEALRLVQSCLGMDSIRDLFTRSSALDEVCREMPVELLKDGVWWSGIIDRLVLRRESNGRLTRAILIDFKTDKIRSGDLLRKKYADQVELYREAVSRALDVDLARVQAVLVSTHLKSIVEF